MFKPHGRKLEGVLVAGYLQSTAEVPLNKVPKPLWVYIPPDANVKLAQGYVLAAINKQNTYSMVFSLLTETLLLKFDRQVKCALEGLKPWTRSTLTLKWIPERPLSPVCS